jgi:transposase
MSRSEQPLSVIAAAHASGFRQRWARQLVHRYNQYGPAGLSDKRADNPGKEPILNNKQQSELKRLILKESPPDGGLWTSAKIADWIEDKTGERPSDRTGLNYLNVLGFSLQQPRPQHIRRATEPERNEFKKN